MTSHIYWTKDYNEYLNWTLKPSTFQFVKNNIIMNINSEEYDSAMFGHWYNEVRKP